MRIYIANLGKYNEGELVGAWFTPPVDYDEMAERIGLNDRYEEYGEPTDWNAMTHERRNKEASDHASDP